jgi:molybdopterin/thiamine biosynthesis adenylyltransferase
LDRTRIVCDTSTRIRATGIPGALIRQENIPGFDQRILSGSKILLIGAGGLVGFIAPTLVRKGVKALTVLDDDRVEPSNLNRQFFHKEDIGHHKAVALCRNLQPYCTYSTLLEGHSLSFQEAVEEGIDLDCDLAICGVDNNPTRTAASLFFRQHGVSVIFTAVSADADHGYVFVQGREGPCFGCVFPDAIDSRTYACPGTPAIADILQVVGGLVVFAVDSCLMTRPRAWNYREVFLSDAAWDSAKHLLPRPNCSLCSQVGRFK